MRYIILSAMFFCEFQSSRSQTFGAPDSEDDTSTTAYYRIDTTLKPEIEEENKHEKFVGLMDNEIFTNDVETFSTLKKTESTYKSYVMARTQYHLTLTQIPLFKKGEIIQERVELRSYSFYSRGKSDDRKMNVNILANFTSPPLK